VKGAKQRKPTILYMVREVDGMRTVHERTRLFAFQARGEVEAIIESIRVPVEGDDRTWREPAGLVESATAHGSARLDIDGDHGVIVFAFSA
jgi:hypothetical protein